MDRLSRRRVLRRGALGATTVAASVGLSGCLSSLGSSNDSNAITLERAAGPGSDEVALTATDRPVLIDFFATWCAPCVPQNDAVRGVVEARPAAHVVSVTNETSERGISQWWDTHGGAWPALMDPDANATSEYSAPRLPTTLVLPPGGGPGDEIWRHVGVARTDAMVEAIDDAAANAGVELASRDD